MGRTAISTGGHGATRRLRACLGFGLLLLILAAALPAAAAAYHGPGAGGWVWQNPRPQGNPLASVKFADATHGWAVGAKGAIVVTADGGESWRAQRSGTGNDLNGVTFLDASRGWAVGDGGAILITADGGQTWSAQASGTSIDLRSVSFADALRGWAVGFSSTWNPDTQQYDTSGMILATADGGATWSEQTGAHGWGYTSVCFVDASHGWVLDVSGQIHATSDSGATWETQYREDAISLSGIAFTDAQHGCAVGADYRAGLQVIIVTSDGGATWRQAYSAKPAPNVGSARLNGIAFGDREHGWAVGDATTVLATVDGGETWQKQTRPPDVRYLKQGDAVAVCAVNARHVWALESDRRQMGVGLLVTTDGGATWSCRGADTFTRFTAVAFADRKRGWAAGYNELTRSVDIVATVDGGTTWRTSLHRDYIRPFQALACVDAKHCWAAHYSPGIGILWRSSDGGATWSYYAKSGDWQTGVGDLTFVSTKRGWAVSGGQIRTTGDGGVSWTDQMPATRESLRGVAFVNARQGWIVGTAGAVIATADGGKSWRAQSSGTGKDLARVSFVDAQNGWAVGVEGAIIATTDGGATWRTQQSGTQADLTGVDFVDARRGWAVGAGAAILATAD